MNAYLAAVVSLLPAVAIAMAFLPGPRWKLASAVLAVIARLLPTAIAAAKLAVTVAPIVESSVDVPGGGALSLGALPAWSQLRMYLPDGLLDPQSANDCGETCVSAVVAVVHGVEIGAGSIRVAIHGMGGSGLTTGADLIRGLAHYNVRAIANNVPTAMLRVELQRIAASGRPALLLGTWPTPGNALHWLLVTGAEARLDYINPWSGIHSWLNWSDVQRFYAGQMVEVQAWPHYSYNGAPEPV